MYPEITLGPLTLQTFGLMFALAFLACGTPPPARPVVSTRIGLGAGRGDGHPWRWHVAGAVGVSRPVTSG